MSNITRVKVELKKKHNDPQRNFKDMLQEFKKRVSNAGILHDYKDHQFYKTKSQKKRKKRIAMEKKLQMENLEKRILGGEQVRASAGLLKKVLSHMNKNNRKKNYNHED